MHRKRSWVAGAVSGVCVLVLLPIALNFATTTWIPALFQQAWVSWTGVAVFGVIAVVSFARAERPRTSSISSPETSDGPARDAKSDDDKAASGENGRQPEIPDPPVDAVPVRLESLPRVRGRKHLLRRLKTYRRKGGLVVLAGAGGMGKSTLARELVRRTAMPESLPAWEVSAAASDRLVRDLHAVAGNLGGSASELDAISAGDRAGPDCLWRLLGRAPTGWLLIVDNGDELGLLGKPGHPAGQPPDPVADGTGWVRAGQTGLVLVTSRQRDPHRWPGSATLLEVDQLDETAAAQVLRDLAPNAGSRRQARALAGRLGCLPLALHLAGRYLSSHYAEHRGFDAYRADLDADPRFILLLERPADDPEAVERMLVMRTWELSLDGLARHGLPQARPLLRLLSCFAPGVPIPLALLQKGRLDWFLTECSEPGRQPARLDQILQGLDNLGLIDSAGAERGLVVHPVVADTNRTHLMERHAGDLPEETVRATAVRLLAAKLDELDIDRPSTWDRFRLLAPHLQALLANSAPRLSDAALDTLTGATGQVAIGYGHMDRSAFGVKLLKSVLAARHGQARAGAVYLLAIQRLAVLLDDVRQHGESEQIWREVFTAQSRDWPADHPIVLAARHNLTVSLTHRQSWDQIRADFDALLADETRALGADHPVTLATRQAYELEVGSHDSWDVAVESLRGVIQDAQGLYGDDDLFAFGARHNLIQVLRLLGRDEVEADEQRLIEDERQALSDDHLLTAATVQQGERGFVTTHPFSVPQLHANFASYLLRKGRAMTNGPERESALLIFDDLITRFGDDTEPDIREIVADGMDGKARLLKNLGRAPEAVDTYDYLIARYEADESIGIRESVAIAFHNKAIWSLGDPENAQEAAERALNCYKRLAEDTEDFAEKLANAEALINAIPQLTLTYANNLRKDNKHTEAIATAERLIDFCGDDPSPPLRILVAKAMLLKGNLVGFPPPHTD